MTFRKLMLPFTLTYSATLIDRFYHYSQSEMCLQSVSGVIAEPARERVSGAPLLRKFGNLSSQKILAVT